MERFFFNFFIVFFLITAPLSHAETHFIDELGDVPLMDGIQILDEAGYVFEQENGRLVERLAATNHSVEKAAEYYSKSLPALGWVKKDGTELWGLYQRDKEQLKITFKKEGNLTLIFFKLNPR